MKYLMILFVFQITGFFPLLEGVDLLPKMDNEKPVDRAPNPSDLQPKWYTYFKVEPEQAFQRIDQLVTSLEKDLSGLSDQDQKSAKPYIEKISTGIRAVIQERQAPPILPSPPVSILDSYTQEQLITSFRKFDTAKKEASRLAVDLEELEEKTQQQQSLLDEARARYLAISETTTKKFILGLEIMGLWASLTVNKQEEEQAVTRLKHANMRVDQHLQEITEAEKRLVLTGNDKELKNSLKQIERELILREERLLQQETMSVGQLPDTPLGEATKSHLAQQTLLARVQVAISQMDLQIIAMLLDLEKMLSTEGETANRKLFDFLEKGSERRRKLEALLLDWETDTAREHTRAFQGQLKVPEEELDQRQLLFRNQQRLTTANTTRAAIDRLQERINEASYLASVLEAKAVTQWSQLGQLGLKVEEAAEDVWKATSRNLSKPLFNVGDVPLTLSGIIRAFLIMVSAIWLSRIVQNTVEKTGDRQKKMDSATFYTLGRLAYYFIVALGSLLALLSLGLDLTTLALVAGALSVGIGFGLQGIVNNFISGLLILFEGQLKVGDFLELESGYRGVVTAVNIRSTVLRTNKGIEVLIPNSEIIGQRTINWTMTDDYRRIHVPFGVAYSSDKELVRKVVLEAADRVPHTVKGVARYRDPVVWLTGFGDNSLDFELVVWVNSPASKSMSRSLADYYWEIHNALIQNNIEIPFPQRDLYIRDMPKNNSLN